MSADFDLVIIGSGFGGSILSMVARRLGLKVLLAEKGSHPRFAIGESTSPLTNLILEQLADAYDLPFLKPLCTYGAWKQSYPELAVGLKRGFTYYSHSAGAVFSRDVQRRDQLMVAASPRDAIGDTHWYRADLDTFLVNKAADLGVEYVDHLNITAMRKADVWTLEGSQKGHAFTATAGVVIDASGPRGALHTLFGLREGKFKEFPATQALFSHFEGAARCDALTTYNTPGIPPYPADDAALHHCFDGGWMWILRFENGITSAGFSVQDWLAEELGLPGDTQGAWQRFLARYPSLGEQFAKARPVLPLVYSRRLSYRAERASGDGWAMLPSAAGFLDPLFSTGIPLTLLGIERLGKLFQERYGEPDFQEALDSYGELTLAELDSSAEFIGASLEALSDFPLFAAFSSFYFAAAAYSEMARRVDRRHLVTRFLAADRADFRCGLTSAIAQMRSVLASPTDAARDAFLSEVGRAIDCLNVAGLADPAKKNWYGVDLNDVINGAGKLGYTPDQMRDVIAAADWV